MLQKLTEHTQHIHRDRPEMPTELSPNHHRIVLASTSEVRRRLLENAGIPFSTEAPRIDETAARTSLTAEGVSPRDQADALADLKASKVASKHPGEFVVGSDQILEFDGESLAKADSPSELREQLAALSGQRHALHTAVVVYEGNRPVWRHVGTARLTMHPLSQAFIDHYVERNWDAVRYSVGGYHVEGEGIALFSRIEGSYFDILGLPLPELLSYLWLRKVITT